MANSTVATDLVANDKVTAAVNKAAAGLKGYADKARASLAGVGSSFKGLAAAIPGVNALTAALSAAGLVGAMGKCIQLAKVQEDAERKLAAVIKATGGAAGLSADEIKKFAAARQNLTNFGDEATIAVAAVLATFKEIKGSVFKEALVSIQDMAAVLGGDMQGKALQLGKALNDPVKGMQALSDAGVSFTEQQKAMVNALQKSGNMLGAQKIILAELKSEFGGAAEAMADPMVQLKNALGDLGERIADPLIPFVRILATDLKTGLDAGAASAAGASDEMGVLGGAILSATDGLQTMVRWFKEAQLAAVKLTKMREDPFFGLFYKGAIPGFVDLFKDDERKIYVEEYDRTIKELEESIKRLEKADWAGSLKSRVLEVREHMRKLREAAAGRGGAAGGGPDAAAVEALQKQIDKLRASTMTPMEGVRSKWRELQEVWKTGRLEAETYRRAMAALNQEAAKVVESQFGPMLTEDLQAKLAKQFGNIERDFQQRFGRNLTPGQAAAEREARRAEATRGATGAGKSLQEQFREAMERAAVARGAGQGGQADQIQREARRALSEGIMQQAREKAGLTGPFAKLVPDAAKLEAELTAIRDAFRGGAFGPRGTEESTSLLRASVAEALKQYGKQAPQIEKPRWEGLQDTWRRIQESAAGKADSPEERSAQLLKENKDVLVKVFGESEKSKGLLEKIEQKVGGPARAG